MAWPIPREAPVTTAILPASTPTRRSRSPGRRRLRSSRAPSQVGGLEQARLQVGPLAHLADEGAGDDA